MKKLLVLSVCVFSLLLVVGCGKDKKVEKNENKLLDNQIVNEVEFSGANLIYENELSTFTVVVTNKAKTSKKVGVVDIIFKDKDGNEIITLKGLVDKELKTNNSASISASASIDLKSAKSIEYKF